MEPKEPLRLSADFLNEPVDLTVKANAQIRIYGGIIGNRIPKLRVGFGWITCLTGQRSCGCVRGFFEWDALNFAGLNSSMRRSISAFQAASASGSLAWSSADRRLTNSPTFSGGQCRASSTICSNVSGTGYITRFRSWIQCSKSWAAEKSYPTRFPLQSPNHRDKPSSHPRGDPDAGEVK